MKVVLFGGTGMVGQGVLRELLLDDGVERVTTVGRQATGQQAPKLVELVAPDLRDLSALEPQLAGHDACIFTLGTSAAGMSEAAYAAVTHDLTLAVAATLLRLNPRMTFIYVSGQGTDSSEQGRFMWARVKGRTENALLRMPFRAAYMFRPGMIVPLHGIRSRTRLYRALYALLGPVLPLLRRAMPGVVTTTEQLGRAMIAVARRGYRTHIIENRDIDAAVAGVTS
jgi:uncharacterized protein YbjT (DUF2867 family)